MTRALVFPGQGSQTVGMGKALYDAYPSAKAVFDEVDDALGEKLSDVIFNGPEDQLTLTANTQPALMAVSLAAFAVLKDKGFDLISGAAYVAGHSLGEYSALAAAGTFSIGDAAKLLRIRGSAMQAAVGVGEGAMAALLGLDWDTAAAVAAEAALGDEVCAAANDNVDGQVVISGTKAAVERAAEMAKERGAKRAIMLSVSAPFHCALMQPAADAMHEALAKAIMNAPIVPVIANVTAAPVTDPDEIRKLLVAQVTGTVRWRESVLKMAELGVDQMVEVGAGKVLAGLVKRNPDIEGSSIGSPDDIEAFLSTL
ncbi:ACP S-malonyltransferase [Magnetovibrio blakemorei]|uniref:Malonyl CoA-acyl carrier protein transacylase n=1 Tax=Magnetovibrio blakemorei TaxID=28181 RepID=A0A1E5Q9X5_9PROT|nr:ACP S-malonyltransferase [Magnetovibrio blakemorei]OEJ68519.1 [acyl-carrier-protein] S-malonyltransferase [Magnetovibrio blakemorei]